MNELPQKIEKHQKDFSNKGFLRKIFSVGKKLGRFFIYRASLLYYVVLSKDTPLWIKTTLMGALGYFISPIDAIPDLTPLIGYTDDFLIISAAVILSQRYQTEDMKLRSQKLIDRIFK
jgi:uncharacterized membrane protein YkvA (DUF1232 family)